MPLKIGIFGGTFDPVHVGHLRIAEEAREYLALDALLFIPAASPPHKPDRRVASFEHRRQMLKIAVEGHPHFQVSDLENRLPGKSYTVITLRKLHEEYQDDTIFYFLLGLDSFLELCTWWHFLELFGLARMVVLRRPGCHDEHVEAFLKENVSSLYYWDDSSGIFRHPSLLPVHCLANTRLGISSSQIRTLLTEGRSIRYLVPDKVMHYIYDEILYGSGVPQLNDKNVKIFMQ